MVTQWVPVRHGACGVQPPDEDDAMSESIAVNELEERPAGPWLVREARGSAPARILIIDDDEGLRRALLAIFAGDPRYEAQAATDGHDGLSRIGTFRPHLVLLDLHLPGLDGAELCSMVKATASAPRILAMSALPEDEARDRMLAAGADAFLSKPFTLSQLEAEVMRLA
jgi:CheY-like chemotaxis protein